MALVVLITVMVLVAVTIYILLWWNGGIHGGICGGDGIAGA